MKNLSPILLFTYNRPFHTQKTVEALLTSRISKESDLYIFCDGIKDVNNISETTKVNKLREYVKTVKGFKSIKIIENNINLGLADSIINGVNSVLETNDKVIVIEDDVIVGKYFLKYVNESLLEYESQSKVYSISGYAYNLPLKFKNNSSYFLPTSSNQAWATWKDRWGKIDFTAKGFEDLKSNKKLKRKFDLFGGADYSKMLISQMEQNKNSWAIRFRWSQFLNDGLTLFPPYNLVENIGWDGSGVNCNSYNPYDEKINNINHSNFLYPVKIKYTTFNYFRLILFFYIIKTKAYIKYKFSSI